MFNPNVLTEIITSVSSGVRIIKFNRPNKKNAITLNMYTQLTKILKDDATRDDIVMTIFTGEGDFYSSGNDFSAKIDMDNLETIILERCENLENFVNVLINYPKLLVAVVNGPAIGIAVTLLALFDIVYASETATFQTPFLNLGICPEAASSYTFPRILGRSKASEMLLLGHKMDAQEAYKFGLVSKVVAKENVDGVIENFKNQGKNLPTNSVIIIKKLINHSLKDALTEVNKLEVKQLGECLTSEEFFNAVIKFTSKKSKL